MFNERAVMSYPNARLHRVQTFLTVGIDIAFRRAGRSGSRIVRTRRIENTVSTVSSVRHQRSLSGSKQPQPAD